MIFFQNLLAFQLLESDRCGDRKRADGKESDHETFTINEQNNITEFATKEEATGATRLAFSSQKELAKLTAEWPVSRFIEIWNGFAGGAPFGELKLVKKFTDRKVAVARIWQAIQRLNAEGAADSVSEPAAEIPLEVAAEIDPVAPEATEEPAFPRLSKPQKWLLLRHRSPTLRRKGRWPRRERAHRRSRIGFHRADCRKAAQAQKGCSVGAGFRRPARDEAVSGAGDAAAARRCHNH